MGPDLTDTIAAIGTPPGGAARGMIRVSGQQTVDCIARCFRANDPESCLADISFPQVISGEFCIPNFQPLPADLFLWPSQQSYTRQPSAELHMVGSPPLVDAALLTLCQHGARTAEPGEFTLRAFLAGRLDLTQAEAVLGVIDAHNTESLATALGQLAGGLSRPLGELREQLLQLLAHLEAGLDFVEEDITFITADEITFELNRARDLIRETVSQISERGQSVSPKVVLVGQPNAGKSSLFNALVREFSASGDQQSALVSDVAGTTRDYLTGEVLLAGVTCELIDTAGIESHEDAVSIAGKAQDLAVGQKRQASCRIICVDASSGTASVEINDFAANPMELSILTVTKIDLSHEPIVPADKCIIPCSSHTGEGLNQLAQAVASVVSSETSTTSVIASTAVRCRDSLKRAEESILSALEVLANDGGEELIAADLRIALAELGRVVGVVYTDDVLDRIFSQFCIGK